MPVNGEMEEQGGPWRKKLSSILKILMSPSWTPKQTQVTF